MRHDRRKARRGDETKTWTSVSEPVVMSKSKMTTTSWTSSSEGDEAPSPLIEAMQELARLKESNPHDTRIKGLKQAIHEHMLASLPDITTPPPGAITTSSTVTTKSPNWSDNFMPDNLGRMPDQQNLSRMLEQLKIRGKNIGDSFRGRGV